MADELRFAGFPSDYSHTARYTTGIDGFEITSFDHPPKRDSKGIHSFSPESDLWAPNFFSEPVLRRKAASLPSVRIQFATLFVDFQQSTDSVEVSLSDAHTGAIRKVRSGFLIGCDGSRSKVREHCGIELQGEFAKDYQLAIHFRAPLHHFSKHKPCVHTWILKPEVRALLVSMNGHDRWRCGPLGLAQEEVQARTPLEWLRLILGPDVPIEILGTSPWGGHYAVAERFRNGRVFLAGDAAHLMWPACGFGMNTGLGDARNLGWKLAAGLQGWAGNTLFDTYEEERKPLALSRVEGAGIRRAADSAFHVSPLLGAATEQGAMIRGKVAQSIQNSARGLQWRTNLPGTDLGYRYNSTITVPEQGEDTLSTPGEYRPSARPGARAPHFWLSKDKSCLDLFRSGFTLLSFAESFDPASFLAAFTAGAVPVRHEAVAQSAGAAVYDAPACLVRPDGFVAWRGGSVSPAEAAAIVGRISGNG